MEHIAALLQRRSMGSTYRKPGSLEYAQWQVDGFNSGEGDEQEKAVYDCPICRNRTRNARLVELPNGKWDYRVADCKCVETRRSIRRMERSGLKNIIRDYTLDKFVAAEPWQKHIKQAAKDYAEHPDGWFFIGGQSGAGKTHICTAICREFLLQGRQVVYMLWREEVVKLKGVANDPEQREPLMDRLKDAQVLYIDDLFKTGKSADGGMQQPTPADINIAFELLNHRYNDPTKLTIISGECTADELLRIDEAVAGRIIERSTVLNIAPDRSRNYRLRKAVTI